MRRAFSRHPLIAILLSAAAWGQTAADRVERLNGSIAALARPGADRGLLARLAAERAAALRDLIGADPDTALRLAMPANVLAQMRQLAPGSPFEAAGEFEGPLETVVSDDFAHRTSRTSALLQTASGGWEVFTNRSSPHPPHGEVTVTGIALGGRIAASRIAFKPETTSADGQQCTTTGPQKIAVIMGSMPSNAFPAAFNSANVADAFFGSGADKKATDSLNGFWKEMSSGLTTVTGQLIGPVSLGQDFSCDQTAALQTAAIAAADGLVDLTQFTRLALVFPVPVCGGYTGLSTLGCTALTSPTRGNLNASFSWIPAQASLTAVPVSVIAHELGHSLGLQHSNSDDYGNIPLGAPTAAGIDTEYGDPFAVMGYPTSGVNTAGQYAAQHKSEQLHWMVPGDYLEVTSSGTFTLAPYETTGLRALRVLRDAASSAWLWVEFRQPLGDVDAPMEYLPGNALTGALIRYEDPTLDPAHTYLLHFNPTASPNDFHLAALQPGSTWSDPFTPLTLAVNSASPGGLSITVTYDQPCATLQYSSTAFGAAGGGGTITVSAPPACSWTAVTPTSWIQLTGATSGTGSGVLGFTLPANGNSQRTGVISLGRQTTTISQGASLVTVTGVTPNSGAGSSATFVLQVNDPRGAAAVTGAFLTFDPTFCALSVFPPSSVTLGTQTFTLGTAGASASSGFCTVNANGSSIAKAGNQFTLTLNMSFSASFAGTHRILAQAYDNVDDSHVATFGQWTVPSTGCRYALDRASQTFAQSGGAATVQVSSGAGCTWSALSAVPWLTITAGASGSGNGPVSFSVSPNTGQSRRAGLISISGQSQVVYQEGTQLIATLAGTLLPASATSAAAASISRPVASLMDAAGNTYIASQQQNAVFKIGGNGLLSLVAGTGVPGSAGDGGAATAAQLNNPNGLALGAAGSLYIVDKGNQVIRKVDASGHISTVAGSRSPGYSGDGAPATNAKLNSPSGAAVDSSGDLYIADSDNHVIRKVTTAGTITTVAGNGTSGSGGDGGAATAAQLNSPSGVAVDASGNLYIADTNNAMARKVTTDGMMHTIAGPGSCCTLGDGVQAVGGFIGNPTGVALDSVGNIYTASFWGVAKITPGNALSTVAAVGAGSGGGDVGLQAVSVAVNPDASLMVADENANRVRRIVSGTVSTFGGGGTGGDGGQSILGVFNMPQGLTKDPAGNLYVADTQNNRVRRIAPDGTIGGFAGTGFQGTGTDGQPAASQMLNSPGSLASDSVGNIFILELNAARIRKVSTGGVLSTVAGGGGSTADGIPATAASLNNPQGIAVDSAGNIYIAGGGDHKIRKVGVNGVITTVAGTGSQGFSGDGGPATSATLNFPTCVAVDGAGTIYFDDGNNFRIRKIAGGVIGTVAGNGTGGASGDGGPAIAAEISFLNGLAVDATGTIYLADRGNSALRKVTTDGTISPLAGTENASYSGDTGAPNLAAVNQPVGIFVDASGQVYFADTKNNVVRVLQAAGSKPVFALAASGSGFTYSATATNVAFAGNASGPVTLSLVTAPAVVVHKLSGSGWTCTGSSCTRSDGLGAGASFPAITATVSALSPVQTQATLQFLITGGGGFAAMTSDLTTVAGAPGACDVNQDGAATVVDAQMMVNRALGVSSTGPDLNSDGVVNVVDLELVVNAALLLGCH